MTHDTRVVLDVTWDDDERDHPKEWDWRDLLGLYNHGEEVKLRLAADTE